jgi:transcriptional regulator with XRE-family HTH domain
MTTEPAHDYVPQFTLGDRLRRLRRDQRLTQGEFAALLGQTDKAYGAWESGTNTPRGDTLLELGHRVDELYGSTARDWLMGWASSPNGPNSPRRLPSAEERAERAEKLAARNRRVRHTDVTRAYTSAAA